MEPVRYTSITDLTVESIKELIQSDEYQIGDKLPSEQQLCGMLQVSRTCVREALRILQARRFLDIRSGKGSFILKKNELSPRCRNGWMNRTSASWTILRCARDGPLAVRLAISHATGRRPRRSERLHERFAAAVKSGDVAGMIEADSRFHSYIMDCSRNKLLININREMQGIINKYRTKQTRTYKNAIEPHERIVQAFRDRDVVGGVKTMREHIYEIMRDIEAVCDELGTEGPRPPRTPG
ncbi:MAG: FadR/GntR family transcriptional regulator [Anaerotruncus massiliensis (ex Togo et al. 2019)]